MVHMRAQRAHAYIAYGPQEQASTDYIPRMAQKKRKARALAASGHLRVCVGVGVRVCFWPVADAARLAVCSGPRWVLLAAGSLG